MFDSFLRELREKDLWIIEDHRKVSAKEFVDQIYKIASPLPKQKMRVYFSLERSIVALQGLFAFLLLEHLVFVGNPTSMKQKLALQLDYIQPHLAVMPNFQVPLFDFQRKTPFSENTTLVHLEQPSILDSLEKNAQIALMTSGTTGESKAVLHRISSLLCNGALHAQVIGLKPSDRVGSALPFHFSYGLIAVVLGTLIQGASLDLAPTNIPENLNQWLQNISVFSATPALIRRIGSIPFKTLTIGGDLVSPALAEKILIQKPDLTLFTTYGLSEAGPRVATRRIIREDCAQQSLPMGSPLPGVNWKIDSNQELIVKTPMKMVGYFRKPDETKSVLTAEGLRTGDLVKMENGEMYFLGRKKRLFSRGGEKIYLAEIENLLQRYPSVKDSYVTSLGGNLQAYVESEASLDPKSIFSFLRSYLPRSHLPDRILCVSTLPLEARKK